MRRIWMGLLAPLVLVGCVVPSGIAKSEATAVPPARVLDTRVGLGAPVGRLVPGAALVLPMAAAVATGAASVSVNLTATEATGSGYLTVWPCGQTAPATSILNFTPGQTVANLANVGLGAAGLCLASSAPVHVVADLMGWFTGSSEFRGSAPTRLLDTRTGARIQANEERRISLAAGDGLTPAARAAALNITVVSPRQDGFVTVYPCGARPLASTVNFRAGEIVPNFTLVPFTANEVCVFSSAATDLVVDGFGWSDNSTGLRVMAPARVLDTRSGQGGAGGPAGPATTVEVAVAGQAGVPGTAKSVLLTVTATGGTADGYVTIWPCDQPRPVTSILNLRSGLLRSNLAFVPLAADTGKVCLWAYTVDGSPVHLVADVVGWTAADGPPGGGGGGGGGGGTAPAVGTKGGGMPLLSRSLPVFASSANGTQRAPTNAQDASNPSLWESTAVPAWLAYDISSVSDDAKRQALVAIYAEHASDYVTHGWAPYQQMPIDYVIETNGAPGGSPPADGWTVVASKTDSLLADPQNLVSLEGANWVRARITRSTDPGTVALNVDVYSAPEGGTDDWLFLGDSITHSTFARAFHDLNRRVNDRDASRWPAVIEAGIGGSGTQTALETIDARLAEFPGRYVVLGYGTNDHVADFVMEALVQKVLAAGKTPVVPHVPWSDQKLGEGPQLNAIIDGLYQKYPQILRGPDLWALLDNTAYVPSGDVHPTAAGQEVILDGYADIM